MKDGKDYPKIVLGSSAIEYIRKCLGYGRTLSHYILDTIDLEAGQIIVGLPEGAALDRVEQYKWGVLPNPPKEEWHTVTGKDGQKSVWVPVHPFTSYVVEIIRSFLRNGKGKLCIIEDPMAQVTDPKLYQGKSHIEIFQDDVYHVLSEGEHLTGEVEDTLNAAKMLWPPLTGILTSLPGRGDTTFIKQKITSETLRVMAERTEKIFANAYDGEAYLIWHKMTTSKTG